MFRNKIDILDNRLIYSFKQFNLLFLVKIFDGLI